MSPHRNSGAIEKLLGPELECDRDPYRFGGSLRSTFSVAASIARTVGLGASVSSGSIVSSGLSYIVSVLPKIAKVSLCRIARSEMDARHE